MHRLHVPRSEIRGGRAIVSGESLAYLREVLRLRPGDPIEVFDGEGRVYRSRVERWVEDGAELSVSAAEERPFAGVRITLAQGLPKGDKLELIVQKSVELGATRVVPVACQRSVVKLDQRRAAERVTRWQRIADEAARQCGRADTMAVGPVESFDAVVTRPRGPREVRLILDEEERARRLRVALVDREASHVVLVGPEGGFARDEVEAAKLHGFAPVTLGPRILRTETVALAVLAVAQFTLGDLG